VPESVDIVALAESQIDEAADLLTRAFFDSPVWTWLAPQDAERRRLMPWFMGMAVRSGLLAGETYTTAGMTRGVAIWEPPAAAPVDLDPDGTKTGWNEVGARMGAEAMARFNTMVEVQRPIRDRVGNRKPHWYLRLLGVAPELQRSGVGSALLAHTLARADVSGVPCLTDTSKPANVPYYARHGFRVVVSGAFPLDGPRYWFMLRESPPAVVA
jgi:GNAT superfamily N-acetyltransferase